MLALLSYYGVVLALALLAQLLLPAEWFRGVMGIGVASLPLIAAAVAVNLLLVRRGWTSWRTLGWEVGADRGGGRPVLGMWALGIGVVGGIALAAIALGVSLAGGAELTVSGEGVGPYAARTAVVSGALLVAALAEEVLFRGYPLARLSKAIGRTGAAVALAVVFGLVHLGNQGIDAGGFANIGLASLLLSAVFFTRGGLWAAWGVHFGWNTGLLLVDAPVSGYRFELPALEYSAGEVEWLTGGAFGPEGGLSATVALALGLTAAIIMIRRQEHRNA